MEKDYITLRGLGQEIADIKIPIELMGDGILWDKASLLELAKVIGIKTSKNPEDYYLDDEASTSMTSFLLSTLH